MIQTMRVCANGWGVAFTCHGDGEVADLRVRWLADLSRLGDADLGHALDADSGAAQHVLALQVQRLAQPQNARRS